ncbi:MAG: hypothetical protein KKB31_05625 [Nanoarchaeota archaeon]|nr:hypothetical protein [Nanoarchaeota archaeon]
MERKPRPEVIRKLKNIIFTTFADDSFSAHKVTKKYFDTMVVGEWNEITRREFNRIAVYTSQLLKELRKAKEIKKVEIIKKDKGIDEKIYKITKLGREKLKLKSV